MDEKRIIIPYIPLSFQRKLHDDIHRFIVLVAARRVGKTTYAVNQILRLAIGRNLAVTYWYIAPYFNQAKDIAWQMFLKYIPKELLANKPNESELTIELKNGAKIVLKGADNPIGLEGIALGGLVIDEVSGISHFKSLWENTLRPMLSDYNSPAIFISKPRGFNHFYDLAKKGDHLNLIEGETIQGVVLDNDYITFRFITEENCREHNGGYINHDEIESARKDLSPEAYDQEYLARFTNYSGLVHKLFSRSVHVIPSFEVPKEWRRIRGWDFGSAHPTASIKVAIDPDDNWFVEQCYKEKGRTIDYHALRIKDQDQELGRVIEGYGDPSGKQWISEFNERGISIRRARKQENTTEKNWIQLGIDKINGKLECTQGHIVFLPDGRKIENAPSLFILNRVENRPLIDELETLAYKESQGGVNDAEIDDSRDRNGHYDLHAAFRYAILSYKGQAIDYYLLEDTKEKTQSKLIEQDREIKEILNDPEKRKELELKEDLRLMKEAELSTKNNWY